MVLWRASSPISKLLIIILNSFQIKLQAKNKGLFIGFWNGELQLSEFIHICMTEPFCESLAINYFRKKTPS